MNEVKGPDGCEVSATCLSCPLPKCKLEAPAVYRQEKKASRDARVLARLAEGVGKETVMQEFGFGQRTLEGIIESQRKGIVDAR